jgi:hypothetical protein
MDPANKQKIRIGKLPPQYTFILNPYAEYRFTRCPNCMQKMKQRKLPLFIHVDPKNPVAINKTCRYCPECDLLLAHQDDIEILLAQLFAQLDPSLIGNEYLVLGTMERQAWRANMAEPKSIPEMLEHVHDFKDVRSVRVQPGGWHPADMDPSDLPVQEPGPLDTPWKAHRSPVGKRPPSRSQWSEIERRRRRRRRK